MFNIISIAATLIISGILSVATPAVAGQQTTKIDPPLVVDLQKTTTLDTLINEISSERVVYVGESHREYSNHLMQLAIIKGLYANNPNLAIGIEWFQQPQQQHLDDYISGKISEAEFLKRTDYFTRWRFDWRLYRPIVNFAAANKIPLIALNASSELTDSIKKSGINKLKSKQKDQLPDNYDFSDKIYENYLKSVFDSHPGKNSEDDFQRFLEVQLTWDESMAQRVGGYLASNLQHQLVVLAGRGHIESRYGIPNRVERRTSLRGKVILVGQQNIADKKAADYLLFTQRKQLPPIGLMGALLETKDNRVEIIDFSKKNAAEKAGAKKGDIIVGIDDAKIGHYAELKLAMLNKSPGDKIRLTVKRKEKKLYFDITLIPRSIHKR